MARSRRPDRPPPIEVLDPGGDEAGLHKVTVARGRADDGEGDGGRRRRGAIAVGTLVAVLVTSLVLSGTGGEGRGAPGADDASGPALTEVPAPTSTRPPSTRPPRTRPSPPRTTATTEGSGPVLPEAAGFGLVMIESDRMELLDLATGERREVEIGRPDDFGFGPVRLGDGLVLPGPGASTLVSVVDGSEVRLPAADVAYASADGQLVWLVQSSWFTSQENAVAHLVRSDGRVVAGPVTLPSDHVVGGDRAGLVLSVYDATYLVSPDGDVRFVTNGVAVGAGSGAAAVVTCGPGGTCGLVVVDLASGERTPVPEAVLPADLRRGDQFIRVQIGPDRQLAVSAEGHSGRGQLIAIDRSGRLLAVVDSATGGYESTVLPDWSGTVLRRWGDTELRWVPFDGSISEPRELPGRLRRDVGFIVAVRL